MKSSRDAILKMIQDNQPTLTILPNVPDFIPSFDSVMNEFTRVLSGIGGMISLVSSFDEVIEQLRKEIVPSRRAVSFQEAFSSVAIIEIGKNRLHQFQDVDTYLVISTLAVAESGAVWLTNFDIPERVLPFITQTLVVVVREEDIVATMHDAYNIISNSDYDFATFISGPSKTADIEQSLVIGAHGAVTMKVFVVQNR